MHLNEFCLSAMYDYAVEFHTKTGHIPYQHGGILPSEMALFVAVCKQQGVTLIVESGRRNGFSTEVLGTLFPRVVSMDCMPEAKSDIRLAKNVPNVTLLNGDAVTRLEPIVKHHAKAGERIAVLLDGPKGAVAFGLGDMLAEHIVFRAHHDVHEINEDGTVNPSHGLAVSRGGYLSLGPDFAAIADALDCRAYEPQYKTRANMTQHGFGIGLIPGGQWRA